MNALVTAVVFAVINGALYFVIDAAVFSAEFGVWSQQQWFKFIGIAAVIVFVSDLVANMLAFNSRFVNALMTAIVFFVLFGGLMYAIGVAPSTLP